MNILSTISVSLLLWLVFLAPITLGSERMWPVKGQIDLSSAFCDFRPRHFHGGIDIRTGGTEGRKIYSPVDGYVWRIKYSYIGYGKGLYLKDSQGYIYVLGHLSKLSDRLEKLVKRIQYENKRYYFDHFFEPDSIPVDRGELIAYSGQTGFGPPHIHFEIRNSDNMPLNPLTNGFLIEDNIPPEIEAIGLIYQDTCSLFPNGERRYYQKPEYDRESNQYFLDAIMFVTAPFGVEIKALDRIHRNGPALNIYRARFFIDDYMYYDVQYESYDYSQTAMVDLSYDFSLAVEEKDYWHLLFNPRGKDFSGSKSLYKDGGIFTGRTQYSYGRHNVRIEIFDALGNMSELTFGFVLAPSGNLFDVEWMSDSVFYLHGQHGNRYLDIEEVAVYCIDDRAVRRKVYPERVESRGTGDYRVTLLSEQKKLEALEITIAGESGWKVVDQYIPMTSSSQHKYRFGYSLTDGGILFNIESRRKSAPSPDVDIIYDDGYIASIKSQTVVPGKYTAFYRNDRINTRIIRFELQGDRRNQPSISKEVGILLAGNSLDKKSLSNSEDFTVTFSRECFYSPALIEIHRELAGYPRAGDVAGRVYSVGPKSIPLAEAIEIAFEGNAGINRAKVGLYRIDDKGKWKWQDSQVNGNKVSAKSKMMGTFALLEDSKSPRVKKILPARGKTVKSAFPEIRCTITDDLSGIENDSNITILLDGHWLIPEYDPETKRLKTYPDIALTDGRHELVITVSDRIGNSRTVYSHFYVKKK